jgi:hypothetical protein
MYNARCGLLKNKANQFALDMVEARRATKARLGTQIFF